MTKEEFIEKIQRSGFDIVDLEDQYVRICTQIADIDIFLSEKGNEELISFQDFRDGLVQCKHSLLEIIKQYNG